MVGRWIPLHIEAEGCEALREEGKGCGNGGPISSLRVNEGRYHLPGVRGVAIGVGSCLRDHGDRGHESESDDEGESDPPDPPAELIQPGGGGGGL